MLTKKDIQLLKEIFVTREEFREEIAVFKYQMRSDILQFKDDILVEIKAMREELAAMLSLYQGHEQRITVLEEKQIAAHITP